MAVCPNGHDRSAMTSATPAACASAAALHPGSPARQPRHRLIARIGCSVVSPARSRPRFRRRTLPALRHPEERPVLRGLRPQLRRPPLHPLHRVRPCAVRSPRLPPAPSGPGGYSSGPPPAPPPAPPAASTAPRAAPPSMSSFPYPQATWTVVVGADRAYYEQVQTVTGPEGAAVAFPSYCAERRFQLVGNQMRIGRRSVSRGLAPEIDLTGPPADPGISRLHAVLIATPDGDWAVLDPGSANGTWSTVRRSASATRYPCTTAIASTSAPGPRSPCTEVRKFSIASTAPAYNDGRLQALTYAHDHQPVLAGPRRGRPGSRCRRQRQRPPASP